MKINISIGRILKYATKSDIDEFKYQIYLREDNIKSIIKQYPPNEYDNRESYAVRIATEINYDYEHCLLFWDYL